MTFSVWNRVRIWRIGRHTPQRIPKITPPPPSPAGLDRMKRSLWLGKSWRTSQPIQMHSADFTGSNAALCMNRAQWQFDKIKYDVSPWSNLFLNWQMIYTSIKRWLILSVKFVVFIFWVNARLTQLAVCVVDKAWRIPTDFKTILINFLIKNFDWHSRFENTFKSFVSFYNLTASGINTPDFWCVILEL